MGTIKDIYDVIKESLRDLKDLAKKAKNQEMLELAMDIQDKIFEIKDQMQELKEENFNLDKELKQAKTEIIELNAKIVDYNELKSRVDSFLNQDALDLKNIKVTLEFTEKLIFITSGTTIGRKKINFTLEEIFKNLSVNMISPVSEDKFINAFTSLCPGYTVKEQQALQIKAQLLSLDLIEISTNRKDEEIIKLTNKGLIEMKKLNTIKQGEEV